MEAEGSALCSDVSKGCLRDCFSRLHVKLGKLNSEVTCVEKTIKQGDWKLSAFLEMRCV